MKKNLLFPHKLVTLLLLSIVGTHVLAAASSYQESVAKAWFDVSYGIIDASDIAVVDSVDMGTDFSVKPVWVKKLAFQNQGLGFHGSDVCSHTSDGLVDVSVEAAVNECIFQQSNSNYYSWVGMSDYYDFYAAQTAKYEHSYFANAVGTDTNPITSAELEELWDTSWLASTYTNFVEGGAEDIIYDIIGYSDKIKKDPILYRGWNLSLGTRRYPGWDGADFEYDENDAQRSSHFDQWHQSGWFGTGLTIGVSEWQATAHGRLVTKIVKLGAPGAKIVSGTELYFLLSADGAVNKLKKFLGVDVWTSSVIVTYPKGVHSYYERQKLEQLIETDHDGDYDALPVAFQGMLNGGNNSVAPSNFSDEYATWYADHDQAWYYVVSVEKDHSGLKSWSSKCGETFKNQCIAFYDTVTIGNSTTTPNVAATVALMMQKFPQLSNKGVREVINATAIDIGEPGTDSVYGLGVLNPAGLFNPIGTLR